MATILEYGAFSVLFIVLVILFLQSLYVQHQLKLLDERSLQHALVPEAKIVGNILRAYAFIGYQINTPDLEEFQMAVQLKQFTKENVKSDVIVNKFLEASDCIVLPALKSSGTERLMIDISNQFTTFVLLNGQMYRVLAPVNMLIATAYDTFLKAILQNNANFPKTKGELQRMDIFILHAVNSCSETSNSACEGFLFSATGHRPLKIDQFVETGFRLIGFSMQT